MIKELPILCNPQVVRNIMSGRQTQHRVPVKGHWPEPEDQHIGVFEMSVNAKIARTIK